MLFHVEHLMRKWQNFDLPNTSIIYTLLIGMAYTLTGTLSLLFSPSGTKALMKQFVADAPKAHESLSTEARRVPVQGTPIPLISIFIASFCFGTILNNLFSTKLAELLGLTVSISLDDSTTAGGA